MACRRTATPVRIDGRPGIATIDGGSVMLPEGSADGVVRLEFGS